MRVDGLNAGLLQKVERGIQPRDTVAVERARLEPRRHLLGLLVEIGLHTRAADLPRADVHALAHAQSARALRAHQRFVPREAQHVDVHLLHVDGQHARALRSVHNEQKVVFARKCADARQIQRVARQVRGMRADDGAGIGTQQPFKIGVVDVPLPVCGNKAQLDIVFPFQPVKRAQDRVVLKVGRDHMLARVDAAMDGDVQRLGRVTGERHVVRPLAAKERGELAARVVDYARGGKRLLVRAARAVAKAPHRRDHRVDDLRRLSQRGRRVVKIDHLTDGRRGPRRSSFRR